MPQLIGVILGIIIAIWVLAVIVWIVQWIAAGVVWSWQVLFIPFFAYLTPAVFVTCVIVSIYWGSWVAARNYFLSLRANINSHGLTGKFTRNYIITILTMFLILIYLLISVPATVAIYGAGQLFVSHVIDHYQSIRFPAFLIRFPFWEQIATNRNGIRKDTTQSVSSSNSVPPTPLTTVTTRPAPSSHRSESQGNDPSLKVRTEKELLRKGFPLSIQERGSEDVLVSGTVDHSRDVATIKSIVSKFPGVKKVTPPINIPPSRSPTIVPPSPAPTPSPTGTPIPPSEAINGETKIVKGAGVNLRKVPELSGASAGTLHFGTVVRVLEIAYTPEHWYRVASRDGHEGWIRGDYLENFDTKNRFQIYVGIAQQKLNRTSIFGDLVDLSNFLRRVVPEARSSPNVAEKLESLCLRAVQKSLRLVPTGKRYEDPYRGWIREIENDPQHCGRFKPRPHPSPDFTVTKRTKPRPHRSPSFSPGKYQLVMPAPLLKEPRSNAVVISRLRSGTKVNVTKSTNNYLRVVSKRGKPSGYIHRSNVIPVH